MKVNKLAVGSIIGVVAGTVTGLLLAPKKGSELRGDTQEKYLQVKGKVSDVLSKMRSKNESATAGDIIETTETVEATAPKTNNKKNKEKAS